MSLDVARGDEEVSKKTKAAEKIDNATADVEKQNTNEKLEDLKDEDGAKAEDEKEGLCGERTLKTTIVHCIAGASIVLNIVAIAVEQTAVVAVAGVIAILFAPVVIFFQLKLQNTDTMRELQNALRKDVNALQDENNKLVAEINVLEEEVAELKEQEKRLEDITAEQGTNVSSFVALVKENRELIDKQGSVVRHETAQLLSSIVINSDGNRDGNFNEQELRRLELKLRALPNVSVDGESLTDGTTTSALLKLIRRLAGLDDNDVDLGSQEEIVFSVTEETDDAIETSFVSNESESDEKKVEQLGEG